ncbi:MAG: hypothetical protein KKH17_12090 [Proteobacteria bacterium]|nr:hypothetical protein [Pseudomonadota bacterium]MBU4127873.1 hypothetical protein [Pseudomonadota bacterium]
MSPSWAYVRWLESLDIDDSIYSMAFKEAGDKIVKGIHRDYDGTPADIFFMPITYLYRHSLELKLKYIIKLGCDLDLIAFDEKLKKNLCKHGLHPLWNYVRKIIAIHWPTIEKRDLDKAGSVIQAFHSVDRGGQNLKYSKNTSGGKTLNNMPVSVDLSHLQVVFETLFNFLDGCEIALYDALELKK